MILYNNENKNIEISDIETLAGLSLFGFYNPDTDKKVYFEISKYKNQLFELVSFFNTIYIDYIVGFNYNEFDMQVIMHVLNNYNKWIDYTNQEIIDEIYNSAQKTIELKNRGIVLYKESNFPIPIIDVFTINGLNNEARYTSLKKLAFQIDGEVEEMPYLHTKKEFTEEEIEEIKDYMFNDINETYKALLITIGKTNISSYKNKNQIEFSKETETEFNIPCLNYSELKIADELMKKFYTQEKNITYKDLPKKGTFRRKIKLKDCIPSFVKFETPILQNLLKNIKRIELSGKDKFNHKFKFYNTTYEMGLGGIHSINENEIWQSDDSYNIDDDDVSSFYPAILVNNEYYPKHLGKELLNVYKKLYEERIKLKPLSKTDKKIAVKVDAYKLILNSTFGKFGSIDSWMFDKQCLYSVTLTGQLCLLMLIEKYELNNIRVISANSDGVTTFYKRELLDKKQKIIKDWENKTNFIIETVNFKKFVYSTVNDYIAIKSDNSVKTKGDFEVADLLYKNKSKNIVTLALQQYFINKILPEQYINNYNNIFDFCIRQKANRNFNYELIDTNTGNKTVLKKLVRYFISKEGYKLMKVKTEECDTNAAPISNVHAPDSNNFQPLVTYCNKMPENKELLLKEVDYWWYIDEAYKVIDKIEHRKFKTRRPQLTQQLGLQF